MIHSDITGLVLAGGRGSRMGGIDKGLEIYRGQPLAARALERLAPQVGRLMLNANRNLDRYRALGVPVFADRRADFGGPLAGISAGLAHCATALLATVPCDTPDFPLDLVARLAAGLDGAAADVAVACTRAGAGDGEPFAHPVFCLMKSTLAGELAAFIDAGERKVISFIDRRRHARVLFEDDAAFRNINTAAELERARQ